MKAFYPLLHFFRSIFRASLPVIIASMLITNAHAQTSSLKAYDFRGKGYDAAMDYVLENRDSSISVIVEVQVRETDTLIKTVGKALKELDGNGYKNMMLLAGDADPKAEGIIECIFLYVRRSAYGILARGISDDGDEVWIYYNKDRKMLMQEYPKDFDIAAYLKIKVREAYKYAGRH